MHVATLPVYTSGGELRLHLARGGHVRLQVSDTRETVIQGFIAAPPRRSGAQVVLSVVGTSSGAPSAAPTSLSLPFASASEAERVAEQVQGAMRLPGTVLDADEVFRRGAPALEEYSPLRALEPLFHITDTERLGPQQAYHLLAALERAPKDASPPRGYMLLPLPELTWVRYSDRVLPGPVAIVAWTDEGGEEVVAPEESRSSERSGNEVPTPEGAREALGRDMQVILSRLRKKAAALSHDPEMPT